MQVTVAPWFIHLQNGDSSLEIKGKEQPVGGESPALGRGSPLAALPAFPRPCGSALPVSRGAITLPDLCCSFSCLTSPPRLTGKLSKGSSANTGLFSAWAAACTVLLTSRDPTGLVPREATSPDGVGPAQDHQVAPKLGRALGPGQRQACRGLEKSPTGKQAVRISAILQSRRPCIGADSPSNKG